MVGAHSLSYASNTPSPPLAAQSCVACHGATGLGMPNIAPMIAGMNVNYLNDQIGFFLSKKRSDPAMTPMAETLTDPQIRSEVLSYFADLAAPVLLKMEQRGDSVVIDDPAKRLVYQGDWSRTIPACSTCHGPSGVGVGAFPRLANQHADYIEKQLNKWKSGERRTDRNNTMKHIATQLTQLEIEQLASFFSAMK